MSIVEDAGDYYDYERAICGGYGLEPVDKAALEPLVLRRSVVWDALAGKTLTVQQLEDSFSEGGTDRKIFSDFLAGSASNPIRCRVAKNILWDTIRAISFQSFEYIRFNMPQDRDSAARSLGILLALKAEVERDGDCCDQLRERLASEVGHIGSWLNIRHLSFREGKFLPAPEPADPTKWVILGIAVLVGLGAMFLR